MASFFEGVKKHVEISGAVMIKLCLLKGSFLGKKDSATLQFVFLYTFPIAAENLLHITTIYVVGGSLASNHYNTMIGTHR